MANKRDKKPIGAELDYGFKWHKWLEEGDYILTSNWETTGSGLVLQAGFISPDNLTTGIWITDGTVKATYLVTNTVTTFGGRTMPQTLQLTITE